MLFHGEPLAIFGAVVAVALFTMQLHLVLCVAMRHRPVTEGGEVEPVVTYFYSSASIETIGLARWCITSLLHPTPHAIDLSSIATVCRGPPSYVVLLARTAMAVFVIVGGALPILNVPVLAASAASVSNELRLL